MASIRPVGRGEERRRPRSCHTPVCDTFPGNRYGSVRFVVAMHLPRGNVVAAPLAGTVLAGWEQGLEDNEKRLTTN